MKHTRIKIPCFAGCGAELELDQLELEADDAPSYSRIVRNGWFGFVEGAKGETVLVLCCSAQCVQRVNA